MPPLFNPFSPFPDKLEVTALDRAYWNAKQELLVSGTNIKTINGNSILGSGNIIAGDLVSTNNLSDVNNQQTALNNITGAATAGDETVMVKDTISGDVLWKAVSSIAMPTYTVLNSTPDRYIDMNSLSLNKVGAVLSTLLNDITDGLQGPQGDPGEGVPVGGTTGQILSKIDGTDYNTEWVDNAPNIPAGGATGEVLSKIDGTDYNFNWAAVSVTSFDGGNF